MDTTNFVSKEKLDAYQRWELDSFDSPDKAKASKTNKTTNGKQDSDNSENVPYDNETTLIHQQAKANGHAEGYKAGHAEGYKAGYETGRKESEAEIKAEVLQIQTLLSDLNQNLRLIDQEIAEELLTLSLDLTKTMFSRALKTQPELILPIVQEAIRSIPNAIKNPRLLLHPDDAKVVREHMGEQLSLDDWEIRENEEIVKGGCRIEMNGCSVDASSETRWRKILSTIGKEDNWLEIKDQDDT
ncbi:MAG: flagellar assembly protein FliH [Nitrosomonas sp.]|nr:flagellar assembly protein FliH [Nitrosomonas sp.]